MKIAVTGCAGFIGANYIEYLFKAHPDYKIVGIDALTYAANRKALTNLSRNTSFTFYHANICDSYAMESIFSKEMPDAVVNFAAESHVDNSIASSHIFIKTNVLGTEVLLDAAKKCGVKRFHQVSTDEVYGDLPYESTDTFDEHAPLSPSSPYSASKAAADLLVLAYHKTHGLPVSISRSANNYGKYQHEEKLIPKIIKNAKADKHVTIYGDGKNIRNWIHVYDNCAAIDRILHSGRVGEIYNIGGADSITNVALAKLILEKLGKTEALIKYVADRPGHDRKYALNTAKIERELGFTPSVDFKDGIQAILNEY